MEISFTNVQTLLSENNPWVITLGYPFSGDSSGNEERGSIHTKKGENLTH